MTRTPDFDDLVGAGVAADDRERLRRAHDQLVQAGPVPELSPSLEHPPAPWLARERHERRPSADRWRPVLLAAALALTAFVVGTLFGGGGGSGSFATTRVIGLKGTAAAPGAEAAIKIGDRDAGGNWPMLLQVEGLRPQPPDGYYTLALVAHGKPEVPCGTFRASRGTTLVRLNAPYELSDFEGWVVTEFAPGGSHDISKQRIVMRG